MPGIGFKQIKMKKIMLLMATLSIVHYSCTKEKTDYEAEKEREITEITDFKEVFTVQSGAYSIRAEALNGTLFTGYNTIRLKVTDTESKQPITQAELSWIPKQKLADGQLTSGPHNLSFSFVQEEGNDSGYYAGYLVFLRPSIPEQPWEIHMELKVNGKRILLSQQVEVQTQRNSNLGMVEFIGKDEKSYLIALVAPQKPEVGENQLIAGIFQRVDALHYVSVEGYRLELDPRMPEPSMGNHSSPNNQDLLPGDDGWYEGRVNYTMTGNWTLNFILRDPDGTLIKGSEVPKDFTPGVQGVKSELHIDILF